MKVHFLNCGTLRPRIIAQPSLKEVGCLCLVVEMSSGLVVVDTGLGSVKNRTLKSHINRALKEILLPDMHPENTLCSNIERLGFVAQDVQHIILTHLDFDHAGGLSDFQDAQVHLLAPELAAVHSRSNVKEHLRYIPYLWSHSVCWQTYNGSGEHWMGTLRAHQLRGLPPEILLIPLQGHTVGHCGVALATEDGWILHAGDAYTIRDEIDVGAKQPYQLMLYRRVTDGDYTAGKRTRDMLRTFLDHHGSEVHIVASHDPAALMQVP